MEHINLLFSLFLLAIMATSSATVEERRPYIVHMDKSSMPAPFSTHESWYMSALSSLSEPSGIAPTHLYTYNHVLHGFSAVLSPSQLEQLERMPGHIATYPESYGHLHTTHTPKFLGLNRHVGLWPASSFGNDTIIGIIDTGVWPESDSFNDHQMPPIPERWRGDCETGTQFNSSNCNRKLIGARSFSKGLKERGLNVSLIDDYDSPRDFYGHGTHTSSTAAGARSPGVDYFGYAKGDAIGMAPMARVAMYKVLFTTDTLESATTDVLAGMDQAIADGVDLMSLSLGFPQTAYYENPIAIGAFAAMEKGIFVACSAGNSGPDGYTIFNGAPWITTVGAGTIDRDYVASVTLGEASFQGRSVYPESLFVSGVPLYYGNGNTSKETCKFNSLEPKDVMGKIVFCAFGGNEISIFQQIAEVNATGAKGAIIATDLAQFLSPRNFYLPIVAISYKEGEEIREYIKKAAEPPTVDIKFQITVLGAKPAPQVADFSSRGPNRVSPSILKPDILAPGVDILAAWASNIPITRIRDDYLLSDYVLISGTSMASPHLVGVAALLRSYHPEWSPAAIRSAIMTTADILDNMRGPIIDVNNSSPATPLDFGSGHINPNKAMDPGLIYDAGIQDYIDFLCGLNYTSNQMSIITRNPNYICTRANLDLNYPSFMVILNDTNSSLSTFSRVLTSVVDSPTTYRAVVQAPTGMKVVVQPDMLTFGSKYSKQGFTVTVEIQLERAGNNYLGNYGYLSWYEVNGKHVVRSPIVSAFAP